MSGDDADGRNNIRRMKQLSGKLSTIAQSLLQYRSEQFSQSISNLPPSRTKMPILTEKNLNAFNVNRHEPSADKPAYRKEDYTSNPENQKPSYPKIQTEDLKLDEKTLKYDPTVQDGGKAEHVEHSLDDDEGDKTVIVSKKGEKLDGAMAHACSCGKKEEDGRVGDVVEKSNNGEAASVGQKLEEAMKEPVVEKKDEEEEAGEPKRVEKAEAPLKAEESAEVKEAEDSKRGEKAEAPLKAEESAKVKEAEKEVKTEQTKGAEKEK
ncbi:hypothetical protein AC578_5324 [Pseudocercospora eumusae]|uniref:Uncharacterized protein n=1 Tax=Pseudocercospora eumusae TaxID=321146 RepID=A0A139GV35_9PEZI|nr:hypothetical protein AC578_5324 [Pseudocercospora eumusae]